MIDWKTLVDNSEMRINMNKVKIQSEVGNERDMFNTAAPDILQYLSPKFRKQILKTVADQANAAYTDL